MSFRCRPFISGVTHGVRPSRWTMPVLVGGTRVDFDGGKSRKNGCSGKTTEGELWRRDPRSVDDKGIGSYKT